MSDVIDTKDWKEFRIGDLFDVVKGSRLTSLERFDGDIPYVGASQFHNGATQFIGNDEKLHPAGVLTVCYNGLVGTTFYQPREFWATDDVNVLYPPAGVGEKALLFVAPMIQRAGEEYVYIDKWKMVDMKSAVIKLPTTTDGDPDWGWMSAETERRLQDSETALSALLSIAQREPEIVDTSQWGEFKLVDLFDMKNTQSITSTSLTSEDGSIPYVTSQEGNNGLQKYVECPGEWLEQGGCIMIGGKTMAFSYQEKDFCSNDSHNIVLYSKDQGSKSEYSQLFLMSTLRASLGRKYSWGDSISMKRIKDESVKLPVTSDGDPDWATMESVMKQWIESAEEVLKVLVG